MYSRFGITVAVVMATMSLVYNMCLADLLEEAFVGVWLLDENSGDVARDASGNGHNGQILGPKWVQGKFKSALQFDGEDDIVEIPHDDAFNLIAYTALAWINVPGPNGEWQQTVVGKDDPAGLPRNFGVFIENEPGGLVLGVNYTAGGQWKTAKGTVVIADGNWHHVAATYDGEFLRAYTDGEMQGETASPVPPDQNTEPVKMGRWGNERGDFIKGTIDELAIFNRALTEDEIGDVMTGLTRIVAVEASGKLATTWSSLKDQ